MTFTETIEYRFTDSELREVIADFISDRTGEAVGPEDIRFETVRGYNGENGGEPYPDRVSVRVKIEV